MSIDRELILPQDVHIVPVADLPADIRAKIDASDQDFTITRDRSRAPSSVVDSDSAELLASFRTPTRIVDAVLSFAGKRGLDPHATLDQAYPVLSRLVRAQLLVPADGHGAKPIEEELDAGTVVGGFRLVRCVQVLDDNEVFLARDEAGRCAAVKFYRSPSQQAIGALEREAALLDRVRGARAPQVFGVIRIGSGIGLVTEWVFGTDALAAADLLRGGREKRSEHRLLTLCAEVARAFADVHEAGLLHGDVHPRNVLVERSGAVRLIDFGLAREVAALSDQDVRGGVPFYFDPQFAQAQRRGQPALASCMAEQYSVAAMLYQMWTGVHYLDWSLERNEMLRQIVEDEPVAFQARHVPPWPELEQILRRALHKRADQRFADLRSLAAALSALLGQAEARDRQAAGLRREPARETDLLDRALKRYELGGEALLNGLPEAPRASINYGAAGVAYALLRIAQRRGAPRMLALADVWSQKAYALAGRDGAFYSAQMEIEPKTVGERSLFHSPAGLHCVRALVSAAQGDAATSNWAMRAFVDHSRGTNDDVEGDSELDAALGKGSLLLGCAELIEAVPSLAEFERAGVRARGEELAHDLLGSLQAGPIESASRKTLGIAHGWGGLIFALLRWARASGRPPDLAVRDRLDELAMLAEPDGAGARWPVVRGGSSFMDGWCNGSAGHVMLCALAFEVTGDARFGELAERAAISAWNSDIPLGTLCCGQAGIGYALLAVHRVTGSQRWVERARGCARLAAADRSPHFLRDALYKGAVGVALLAEELNAPAAAAMPLFEPVD
ncbi:MAG TPA: lanthionine synthetase LanC family protein [Burkholderiaceae bacterium]|nr:lanthionine synthetase LanC family protein [Burkholderiaceae bacterium]